MNNHLLDKAILIAFASAYSVSFADTHTNNGPNAINLLGGAAGSIPYQSGADTTVFLPSSGGSANQVLTWGASAPSWANAAASSGGTGTVTSVSVTTANGVSATVASSNTTPALTFTLGDITPNTVNRVTLTTPASNATLTIANGKTLTANSSLTLAGTDGTVMSFPANSATIARTDLGQTFTGHQTIEGVTSTGATGTGAFVFNSAPTLANPNIGDGVANTVNRVAFTRPAANATLTIVNGKTLTANNSITLAGTDGVVLTTPSTSFTAARIDAAQTFTGHQTIEGVTSTGATGTGAFVFNSAPTLIAAQLSDSFANTLNRVTITLPASNSTLTIVNGKTLTANNSITLAGVDGKVFTANNTFTMAGTDGVILTYPPANSALGYLNIPVNSQSANYTVVLADAGKTLLHPSTDGTARTFTIDSNANIGFALGTAITFANMSNQVLSVAITSDTLYLCNAGTTGTRALAAFSMATAVKMTSTTWLICGNGLTWNDWMWPKYKRYAINDDHYRRRRVT